jgi:hypothetical protein
LNGFVTTFSDIAKRIATGISAELSKPMRQGRRIDKGMLG